MSDDKIEKLTDIKYTYGYDHGYNDGLSRTLCDVLEEMRRCVKTLNFASLLSLVEEAQTMGNRMEASLNDYKSALSSAGFSEAINDEISKLKKLRKDLRTEIVKLEKQAKHTEG